MTPTSALIWKEWRELRWSLLIGAAVFIAIPCTDVVLSLTRSNYRSDGGLPVFLAIALGGPMAILVAATAVCRDLDDRLRTFWTSRPISTRQWLLTGYFSGLAVVTTLCLLCLTMTPILSAITTVSHPSRADVRIVVPVCGPLLALVYSMSFLLGCLVRRPAHAALLSLSMMLLVYFAPVVVPPLSFLSSFELLGRRSWPRGHHIDWRLLAYVSSMMVGCVVSVLAAMQAVRRNWELRLNLRLMCCALGVVALLLFAGTAFQLRSDLVCERTIAVPTAPQPNLRFVLDLAMVDRRGMMLTFVSGRRNDQSYQQITLIPFDLSRNEAVFGRESVLAPLDLMKPIPRSGTNILLWSADTPQHAWALLQDGQQCCLHSIAVPDGTPLPANHALDLSPHLVTDHKDEYGRRLGIRPQTVRACLIGRTIYVYEGVTLLTLSPTDPAQPALSSAMRIGRLGTLVGKEWPQAGEQRGLRMAPLPNIDPKDRLDATLRLLGQFDPFQGRMVRDGDTLVTTGDGSLRTFRIVGFEGDVVRYEPVGLRFSTPVERWVGSNAVQRMVAKDGLLWAIEGLSLTVYDIRRPEAPRRAGHYATGDDNYWTLTPLLDRRILMGAGCRSPQTSLRIVAPPRLE